MASVAVSDLSWPSTSRLKAPGQRKPAAASALPRPSAIAPPAAGLRAPRAWSPAKPRRREDAGNQSQEASAGDQPQPQLRAPGMSLRIQVPPAAPAPALRRSAGLPPLAPPPAEDAQSDNIRVVLRIRPMASEPKQRRCLEVAPDRKGVTLAPASAQEKRFGFDRVFPESCEQDDVFVSVGRAAVENALKGYNGSIFAYGQTGSGKTFTMLGGAGLANAHELRVAPSRGLMPRIFDYLFQRLTDVTAEKGPDNLKAAVSCSYLEIYNEKIFDLLEDNGSAAAQQPKSLREDSKHKEVYVDQLREEPIDSEEAAIDWLRLGSRNRHMASTDMNRESSRSHAVFTLKLVQTERTTAGVMITRRSHLHLIDLAGSEKQRQTHVEGQRLKEAAQINKSLSALGNVIMSLVDVSNGQKRHVHYRDSKLTFLLRDSLGGNAITSIIATISAEEKYFTETLSTLKFAQRAKYIKNKAVQNEDADSMVPMLKQEIERLRQEIEALRATGVSPSDQQSTSSPEAISTNQLSAEFVSPPTPPKKNRWEPALDVMSKLLLSSGAAAEADLDDEGRYYMEVEPPEVRCERLEMLLYRMICRLEEYKEIAFAPERSRHRGGPQPSGLRMPSVSLLPAPRKYGSVNGRASNQQLEKKLSCQSNEETEKLQEQLKEVSMKAQELEAENLLIQVELCQMLELKAVLREQQEIDSEGGFFPSPEQQPTETSVPTFVATDPNEELLELVNMYRSLFDEVKIMLDEKKPVLRAPRSPRSSSSDTMSMSYASEDEESIDGDSPIDAESDANDSLNLDDGDSNEREMRRIHGLNKKLEKKLEQYQDVIQRLEKDLQATQDELETSNAASKFAEFQLQQMRDLASEEAAKSADVELSMSTELAEAQKKLEAAVAAHTKAENVLKLQIEALNASNQQLHDEKLALDAKYSGDLRDLESRVKLQDEKMRQLLDEKAASDIDAIKRDHEVAQYQVKYLQGEVGRCHSDEARQVIEAELEAARSHIQQLEEEAQASEAALKAARLARSSSANGSDTTELGLKRMLETALVDNEELMATIRDLQVKRQSDSANMQVLWTKIHFYALQAEKSALLSKQSPREKELADQVEALERQLAHVRDKSASLESQPTKVSTIQ